MIHFSPLLSILERVELRHEQAKARRLEYHLEEHLELQARGLSTRYYYNQ